MWDNLINVGWHPHKIEVYEYAWQYALHPTSTLMIGILAMLFAIGCIIKMIDGGEDEFIVVLIFGTPFIFFGMPYVLIALIFTWPLWVGILVIIALYITYVGIANREKPTKVRDKSTNYKKELLKGLTN